MHVAYMSDRLMIGKDRLENYPFPLLLPTILINHVPQLLNKAKQECQTHIVAHLAYRMLSELATIAS